VNCRSYAPVIVAGVPDRKINHQEDTTMFTCLKHKTYLFSLMMILLLTLSACSILNSLPGAQTADEPAVTPLTAQPAQAEAAPQEPAQPQPVQENPSAQAAPASASMDGNWANEDQTAPGITRMIIRSESGTVYVQMWTHCDVDECSWDEQAVPQASPLTVTWKTAIATNLQTITLLADGRLQVSEEIEFTDGSGRGGMGMTSYLVKQ
jgi:hypothetical protein